YSPCPPTPRSPPPAAPGGACPRPPIPALASKRLDNSREHASPPLCHHVDIEFIDLTTHHRRADYVVIQHKSLHINYLYFNHIDEPGRGAPRASSPSQIGKDIHGMSPMPETTTS